MNEVVDKGDKDCTMLSVVRRDGIEFVRELKPGETWAVFAGGLIIAHPDREPEFIKL